MRQLDDLFNSEQLKMIHDAPLFMGTRHPTWFPLFNNPRRAIDHLVNEAVARISSESNGDIWLHDLIDRLLNLTDIRNASSVLAEIRAYGALLEAGFNVVPIPRKNDSTPDFEVNAGDGSIIVEVFAKHQDESQDELLEAIHSSDSPLPDDVERKTIAGKNHRITITTACLTPGGRPDPAKPNDSVQANLVSRICSIKQNESQIPNNMPALLIMDFVHFGGPYTAELLKAGQTTPLECGHGGFTSGSIWYGLYGWKGAPIYEAGLRRPVKMGHDGRFRLQGNKKSKLSAVLVILAESVILLENPWATHQFPASARLKCCRYPWFDLSRTIASWQPNQSAVQVALHEQMIETIEHDLDTFRA